MDSNQVKIVEKVTEKFDNSDILGYIVPGAVFLLGIYIHDEIFGLGLFGNLQERFAFAFDTEVWYNTIFLVVPFLLFLCYSLGHLIATFSSIIMDKWAVERIFGFPYQRLLDIGAYPDDFERSKREYYKLAMSIFLGLVIYFAVKREFDIVVKILLIAWAGVLGLKIGTSSLVQPDIKDRYSRRDPKKKQTRIGKFFGRLFKRPLSAANITTDLPLQHRIEKLIWKLLKWPLKVLNSPYDLFTSGLLSLLIMQKTLSVEFRKECCKMFEETFGLNPKEAGTETYWLTYIYVCEKSPVCASKIHRWLCMYSFLRNFAISLFLLFIYGIVISSTVYPTSGIRHAYLWWCLVTGIGTVIFGVRYYYIYVSYYSKFIFRAFYYLRRSELAQTNKSSIKSTGRKMKMEYEIIGQWEDNGEEMVFVAKAIGDSQRILAKVVIHSDVQTATNMEATLGLKAREEMENAAKEALQIVVAARWKDCS